MTKKCRECQVEIVSSETPGVLGHCPKCKVTFVVDVPKVVTIDPNVTGPQVVNGIPVYFKTPPTPGPDAPIEEKLRHAIEMLRVGAEFAKYYKGASEKLIIALRDLAYAEPNSGLFFEARMRAVAMLKDVKT